MIRSKCACWLVGAILLASMSSPILGNETPDSRWFSISLDNDIFAGTDGGYTNGMYASWYYAPIRPQSENELPWYFWLQTKVANTTKNARQIQIHNISQTMITPTDIQATPPDPTDSPYAGLLFWQGSILSVNDRITNFSSLMVGVLGPASLAEQSQKIVHKLTGSDEPRGWSYQLDNEAVVGFNYGRYWRWYNQNLGSLEFDSVVGANGFLGNLITALDTVGYIRIGSGLESTYPVFALASNREINPTAFSGGWFVYVGVGVIYTFQDLLYDRHTIRKTTSASTDDYAESLSIGAAISGNKWGFSINYTEAGLFGSRRNEPQKFGSLTFLRKLD